jgi:hypothetical protein
VRNVYDAVGWEWLRLCWVWGEGLAQRFSPSYHFSTGSTIRRKHMTQTMRHCMLDNANKHHEDSEHYISVLRLKVDRGK